MRTFLLSAILGLSLYVYRWTQCKQRRRRNPNHITDLLPRARPLVTLLTVGLLTSLLLATISSDFLLPEDLPYMSLADRLLSPSSTIIIGLAFGFTFADWSRYVLQSHLLQDENVRRAHARWGIALAFLLIIGAFAPTLRGVMTSITTVSAPVLGATIEFRRPTPEPPRENISSPISEPSSYLQQTNALALLDYIPEYVNRDRQYISVLYDGRYDEEIKTLLDDNRGAGIELVNKQLIPLGLCLSLLVDELHDETLMLRLLNDEDLIGAYRRLLRTARRDDTRHDDKNPHEDVRDLCIR